MLVQVDDADTQIPDTNCSVIPHYRLSHSVLSTKALYALCMRVLSLTLSNPSVHSLSLVLADYNELVNKYTVLVCELCSLDFISMVRLQSIDTFAYSSCLSLTPAKSDKRIIVQR